MIGDRISVKIQWYSTCASPQLLGVLLVIIKEPRPQKKLKIKSHIILMSFFLHIYKVYVIDRISHS